MNFDYIEINKTRANNMKVILLLAIITLNFGNSMAQEKKGKIVGLGGVFFKAEDPAALKKWYTEKMGLECDQYGHLFTWIQDIESKKTGTTQWSIFDARTKYFDPSKKDYMINYRVENLAELLEELKKQGVQVVGGIDEFEYGKFAWVMDPEGNKLELWEPVDEVFFKDK